eukprot:6969924-Prymnesium_polylepis.1
MTAARARCVGAPGCGLRATRPSACPARPAAAATRPPRAAARAPCSCDGSMRRHRGCSMRSPRRRRRAGRW